uniref:hypothetical protein n=1 Tax=unclassified Endozoicomonas TaxID=2644528 RepID=UPI002147EE90
MTLWYSFNPLLFSLFLFFYQQGLANDTYGLEEYLQYQMTSWKPLSKKQQNSTSQPGMSPLENIRIGFVRLNLASADLSGDERMETCEDYEVTEQGFNRLNELYFHYVNMGDSLYRKGRIQRMLRLIHRIFAININRINGQSSVDREIINETAKNLFEQFFLSANINGNSNPYFNCFYLAPAAHKSHHVSVNNDLVVMFFAFLGPHFLSREELYVGFRVSDNIYTGESYDRAFDRALLSENITEYNFPQSLANQLNMAELDAETALLIGLTAMATAAFQRLNSGTESHETLEAMLICCLPYELLPMIYQNIASHCCSGNSHPVPEFMDTLGGMHVFTYSIVGIDLTPTLSEASSPDSDGSVEESDSEHQDPSIVIQQQNELIAQLRQEL